MLEPTVPSEPWPDVTCKYAAKTSLDTPGSNSCEFKRTLDELQSLCSTLPRPNVTPHMTFGIVSRRKQHDLVLDHANEQFISLSIALSWLFFLNRTWDLDLMIYISNISPLIGQLCFIMTSPYSHEPFPSCLLWYGPFLVLLLMNLLSFHDPQ